MAYTNDSIWKSVDWMTICIYLMLVIFGWFSVCGASYDYGEIDFFSFDTRAGKQFVWICCSLGLGFILMMLEDKLYDMFAYILYGGMMLLLLITPFLAEDTKGSYSWIKFGPVSLQPPSMDNNLLYHPHRKRTNRRTTNLIHYHFGHFSLYSFTKVFKE